MIRILLFAEHSEGYPHQQKNLYGDLFVPTAADACLRLSTGCSFRDKQYIARLRYSIP